MDIRENTKYDLSKVNQQQRLEIFLTLYAKATNEDKDLDEYIRVAEEPYTYTLEVLEDYEWIVRENTERDAVCASTLFLKFPRVVQVRDSEQEQWVNRVAIFIDHKDRPYTYQSIEKVDDIPEEAEKNMLYWNYYRELQPKTKLTLQEIADKFNLTVEEIEIV